MLEYCWWEYKLMQPLWKTDGGFSKIKNRTTKNQVDAEILLLDSYPKTDDNINLQIYICVYIFPLF